MKRNPEKLFNRWAVKKYYSLFKWVECHFCQQEFKRESGYKWLGFGMLYNYSYACNNCCASIGHCNDMIDHQHASTLAIMQRTLPPAPPFRSYRDK